MIEARLVEELMHLPRPVVHECPFPGCADEVKMHGTLYFVVSSLGWCNLFMRTGGVHAEFHSFADVDEPCDPTLRHGAANTQAPCATVYKDLANLVPTNVRVELTPPQMTSARCPYITFTNLPTYHAAATQRNISSIWYNPTARLACWNASFLFFLQSPSPPPPC